jgi:Ser/Thr protein kinase RdoA (MazF antagonist)
VYPRCWIRSTRRWRISSAAATDLFLGLVPDAVLSAIEATGLRCTSVCWALNSYENRVYEIELQGDARTRLVAKFYRPGRWSRAQILEEHAFLAELYDAEVPVVPVRPFPDGETLKSVGVAGGAEVIWFCLFPRFGGRAPEEIDDARASRLGALCARIHNVGAKHEATQRVRLTGDSFAREALGFLEASGGIPTRARRRFVQAAQELADLADEWLEGVPVQRIHGDFHLGNLIEREGVMYALDFDDSVVGPPVQDLWMLLPGRDPDTLRRRGLYLEAYEHFRSFDRSTLRLIEPLRGLRLVHYAGWLARRWHDPIFPQTWPDFGTEAWWLQTTEGIEEALDLAHGGDAPTLQPAEPELSNADLFWDWQEPKG